MVGPYLVLRQDLSSFRAYGFFLVVNVMLPNTHVLNANYLIVPWYVIEVHNMIVSIYFTGKH